MNRLCIAMALAVALGVCPAFAQDQQQEDHSAHHPPPAPAAPDAAKPAEHEHGEGKANPLQDKMKQVEALMQQVQQASDPAQKRELLSQHLTALNELAQLIRAQRGDVKMSMKESGKKDMMGGMMKEGGMMSMHKKVEQRLDLLERMMEQVIDREVAEESLR
jgi:hypothetical protein